MPDRGLEISDDTAWHARTQTLRQTSSVRALNRVAETEDGLQDLVVQVELVVYRQGMPRLQPTDAKLRALPAKLIRVESLVRGCRLGRLAILS